MIRFLTLPSLFLALTTLRLCAGEAEDDQGIHEGPLCTAANRRPGFASVSAFVAALKSPAEPWLSLLTPDAMDRYVDDREVSEPYARETEIVYRSKRAAIVFSLNRPSRYSPFSAVAFLLVKRGARFHVADFVRRSTIEEANTNIETPQILNLRPRYHIHFQLSEYFGGRRWGVDTEEFFMVRGDRLRRTLLVRNAGGYTYAPPPYRGFTQYVSVDVVRGQPMAKMMRSWMKLDGDDVEEEFSVHFRWNPREQKFVSPRHNKVMLPPTEPWATDHIPMPSARRP